MAAGYGMAIKAVAGGINGYFQGEDNNARRAQILAAYAHPPKNPNLNQEMLKGYFQQIQDTPQLLALDRQLRSKYGLQDASRGASIYSQVLPQYANANMRTLGNVDPQFLQGRNQLYGTVSSDLAAGSSLTPDMEAQLDSYVRGGQSARGNMLGNANISSEAFTKGAAGQALKQQRIGNMETFLKGPSPEDKFASLAGAGMPSLAASAGSASNPGYSYIEGPHNWGDSYRQNAQQEYSNAASVWQTQAQARANAPTEVNPWLASFQAGLGAIAGGSGGGGGGGGGGMGGMGGMGSMFGGGGSNVSSNPSTAGAYNSMMG